MKISKYISLLICIILIATSTNINVLADAKKLIETNKDKSSSIKNTLTTNRFIVKYKDDKGRDEFNGSMKNKLDKVKHYKGKKNQNIDIITTKDKMKKDEVLSELKSKNADSNIEYIQPDYELKISSNDTYFENQWGLHNKAQVPTGQQNATSNNDIAIDINSIIRFINEPIGSDILINLLQSVGINDSDYEHALQQLEQSHSKHESINAEEVFNLINKYILNNQTYKDRFISLLPKDMIDLMTTVNTQNGYNVDAAVVSAWEKSQGKDVLVAVLDTGIDITHEDLAANIVTNSAEISGNGIDDDGNGYIDDVNGWNFYDNNNMVHQAEQADDEVHGTQVAGIIAATNDNSKGIAGIAPAAKILTLKVFKNGKAYTSEIIAAIEYAEKMGAKIVNCSWGSADDNPALKEAIAASNMLFICAAGNNSASIDSSPIYPAAFDCPNIISVASINASGNLSSFSNYGETSVDVAAPGENIESTKPGNTYGENSGTSMAAAFVTGESTLLVSKFGSSSMSDIKQRIINSSDKLSTLQGKVYEGRKINCSNAVNEINPDKVIEISGGNTSTVSKTSSNSSRDYSLFASPTITGQFTNVASGWAHSLFLKNDGTVWACGYNNSGALGDRTSTNKIVPVQVAGLTGIKSIAAGSFHSIALMNDGTVWTWGDNDYDQLGDGTTAIRYAPVQVQGLTGITSIASGANHSIALKSDGTVWTWGYNGYGQLGDGTATNRSTPVQVLGLTGVISIASGSDHTIALKNDGTIWTFGSNHDGELGDGTTTDRNTPVQVSGVTGVMSAEGGSNYTIALKNDGTVWACGYNNYGELGDGTTTTRNVPVQISGLVGVKAIAAGYYHTIAVKNDGTVWIWGYNNYGQLGDGTFTKRLIPEQVPNLAGVNAVAGGGKNTIALKNDGTVWIWGDNNYGEVGDGTVVDRSVAGQVAGISGVKTVAGSYNHTIALKNDSTVWAWGWNYNGQIGDGTTIDRTSPVQVSGLTEVKAITAGYGHSVVLKNDGTVWAWGLNDNGQLGDGTSSQRSAPVMVASMTGITAIACGNYYTISLKNDGTVWAWGDNQFGQLGDGTNVSRYKPIQVPGLTGIIAIACGNNHTIALKNDGTVWTWGYNHLGELGDGTTTNKSTPVQVSGLTSINAIEGGYGHSIALKNDGTVWTWGYNNYGQLGDGTTTQRLVPIQVPSLSGVTAVSCGAYHTMVLKSDGTEWAWGDNAHGKLGDGTTTARYNPVQVLNITGVVSFAGGYDYTMAVKGDGNIFTWGSGYYGQLGNGVKGYVLSPEWVLGTAMVSGNSVSNVNANDVFNFNIVGTNLITATKTVTVKYNPSEVQLVDLCSFTPDKDVMTSGIIPGTDITVNQNSPGTISFTTNLNILSGKAWSGILNILKFKANVSKPQISYTIQ